MSNGGARVSTGNDSKQDYRTPADLMTACRKRFGPVGFDLAATASNAQHERYFAPSEIVTVEGKGKDRNIIRTPHHDSAAYALDAFRHSWAEISRQFGLCWLNCEFGAIADWSARCKLEGNEGARILLLTPASVGANWFSDHVAGCADIYYMKGRPAFIAGEVYNKDCMISHYGPGATGMTCVWDWRKDIILHRWHNDKPREDTSLQPPVVLGSM